APGRRVVGGGAATLCGGVRRRVAGRRPGAGAMLAGPAHWAADTLNQAFLLTSVHRGARPADPEHPFGYGQERYFWSLLAAFGIFVAGAGFSIFEGILALGRQESGDPLIAYIVLAAAGVAESISFIRAYSQMRGEARRDRTGLVEHVQRSPDTTVKAALFEDSAAMIGLVLAAAGLALRQLTGSGVWDAAASMAIGALLIVVAVKLGVDSRSLLIGRAADPDEQQTIREEIEKTPGVDALIELLTMHLGPDDLLVAARVDFSGDINADDAEDLASKIDRRLAELLPVTPHVFIDPTR